ncbi:hypothetical protein E2562_014329 [Oryza meyeriana var. granulata]|uniref:Uncharacterized protein n=1 Tax=Oryza meyeriana var. granulata TaxID=110450 RepID=A0A6G1C5I8_9ORYZ|nr:hypothetical protein E2562_014329 [Oryza meyeriana var. granulata]
MEIHLSLRQSTTATLSDNEYCSFWHCTHDDNDDIDKAKAKKRYVSSVTRQWCSATRSFIVYLYADSRYHDFPELLSVRVEHWPNLKWSSSVKINGEVSIVTGGADGSSKVAADMTRLAAIKIVDDIVRKEKDLAEKHVLQNSAEDLHDRWRSIQSSDHGREASEACLVSRLAAEMREMEERLLNNYLWQEYMLSWLTCQAL